ncbi:MAG: acetyl-CoA decarbonylase/synthase complex subunit gamma [Chitinivibrionales bacterium]|nr:acetyl-CoA decarbonylase/synthase complex subunit gamma [Chitinivibrionales bacterium]
MALTGLQIQKLLPRTNCKECGSNTCMAFAMKLASKKADLSQCPYASDEAKNVLGAASEPPVKAVALGKDNQLKFGEETVLYRHEKTFVHQLGLALEVSDTDDAQKVEETLTTIGDYVLERVGESLTIDCVSVSHSGDDTDAFVMLCQKASDVTGKPVIVNSKDADALHKAAEALQGTGAVLANVTEDILEALLPYAREKNLTLSITAPDIGKLVALSEKARQAKCPSVLLQFETYSLAEQFQTNSIARRAALKNGLKTLGYPYLRFVNTGDTLDDMVEAIAELTKYGGICVLPSFNPAQLAPLMTLRQNIFTDPQKPIQVEPKVYPIGEPKEGSPVFVTTNFSLTYFIVSGEIENSGISAWLIVPECEGMSVLTSWAAGKFSGASIGKFVKESGFEDQVSTREIIIPGYVAGISGELEEALPGWKAVVGPPEAGDLESFIKARCLVS